MLGIQTRELAVRFGERARAVDGVDLSIEPGELFLLLGPSGCGKTTLLRAIAGFVAPTSGSIWFGAEDVTRLPAHRRGAGMVFQGFALWPHMTVAGNVGFGLRQQGVRRAEAEARIAEALATTRIADYGARRIDELSGGEQQRVALARALVVRPRCLLLDEPLSNLDARLRQTMREEVRRICKSFGLTTIYVTHDQKEALAVADRIAVMERGRIVQVGSPADVYRRPRSRQVAAFLGDTNLIDGRVIGRDGGHVEIESPLGAFIADADPAFTPEVGDAVCLSIRPECLRPAPSEPASSLQRNVFNARETSRVYLGEIAERRLQVADVVLSAYELNPQSRPASNAGELGTFTVDPGDVVLLPALAAE